MGRSVIETVRRQLSVRRVRMKPATADIGSATISETALSV